MQKVNQPYLIVDRTHPRKPRWVIVTALWSTPAVTPGNLDGPGAAWLREFGHEQFAWLHDAFDRDVALRVPQAGAESYATRISDMTPGNRWREHFYVDDTLGEDWPGTWAD